MNCIVEHLVHSSFLSKVETLVFAISLGRKGSEFRKAAAARAADCYFFLSELLVCTNVKDIRLDRRRPPSVPIDGIACPFVLGVFMATRNLPKCDLFGTGAAAPGPNERELVSRAAEAFAVFGKKVMRETMLTGEFRKHVRAVNKSLTAIERWGKLIRRRKTQKRVQTLRNVEARLRKTLRLPSEEFAKFLTDHSEERAAIRYNEAFLQYGPKSSFQRPSRKFEKEHVG
jgi:hypothetical protein